MLSDERKRNGAVYSQLSITERRKIERWRHAKVPVNEIACVLGRCRSMIFRELKRNHFSDPCLPKCDGYYGAAAQLMAAGRRARQRKLIRHPELCRRVVERLKNGWTPEQIGKRMILEGARLRVCQETIYRYIYSKEGMTQDPIGIFHAKFDGRLPGWQWQCPSAKRRAQYADSFSVSISCFKQDPFSGHALDHSEGKTFRFQDGPRSKQGD